jgi:SAM-dependent methyltransferase
MISFQEIKKAYFEARPPKSSLYRKIYKEIQKEDWGKHSEVIGIDAACARFEHRKLFFPVKRYIGLDMNEERLREGLRKHPDDIGILCDICTIDLPEGCADLIISSNTLYWIKDEKKRLKVVQTLAKAVKPKGKLIIEMPNDKTVSLSHSKLQEEFDTVLIYYVGNYLSVLYDKLITRKKDGYPCLIARTIPAKIVSLFLSLYETYRYKPYKKHALFICTSKKSVHENPLLIEDDFIKISSNLYRQKTFNNK